MWREPLCSRITVADSSLCLHLYSAWSASLQTSGTWMLLLADPKWISSHLHSLLLLPQTFPYRWFTHQCRAFVGSERCSGFIVYNKRVFGENSWCWSRSRGFSVSPATEEPENRGAFPPFFLTAIVSVSKALDSKFSGLKMKILSFCLHQWWTRGTNAKCHKTNVFHFSWKAERGTIYHTCSQTQSNRGGGGVCVGGIRQGRGYALYMLARGL